MPSLPKTQYTKSGEVHIAYQATGERPIDLVVVPGFVSHLEYQWELPESAHLINRLASFSRAVWAPPRAVPCHSSSPQPIPSEGVPGEWCLYAVAKTG
jgi:hypothetical protein